MTWAKATAIRVLATMCETAIGIIGAASLIGEVNWVTVISATALSGIVTLLRCGASTLPEVDTKKK